MSEKIATEKHEQDISTLDPPSREVLRENVDLLTLHRQLLEIEISTELSKQDKIAKSLELLTSLTNAAGSGYFYLDINNVLVVGPRILSKKSAEWDEDIMLTLHQAAKNSIETGKVFIDKLKNQINVTILAAPCFEPNGKHSAVTQLLELHSEPIESFVVILQLFVSLLSKRQTDAFAELNSNLVYTQALFEARSLARAERIMVDKVLLRHPEVMTWIGSVKRKDIHFGAISNSEKMNKRGAFATNLTQAMMECLRQDKYIEILNVSREKNSNPILNNAYKAVGQNYFALVPLHDWQGKTTQVIGFASNNETEFHMALSGVEAEKNLLGNVFGQQASGLLGAYRDIKSTILDSKDKWFKYLVFGMPLLLLALLMLPVTYKINTSLVIEPVERRFISAPFNSILKEVFAKPGDVINEGQVIAELDDRELKWKYSQLEAEYEQAIKQKDIEIANGDTAKMQLSKYEASQFKAKLELVQHQLKNLKLSSPIKGQLVSGDIKKREGGAVSIGDNLFEIAPLEQVLVELEVPAEDISYVEKQMPVKLRINALPNKKWDANIISIQLRSTLRQDENVFVAELMLENNEKLLRPGMEGKAKIYADKKSLGWVLFHRAWNKLIEFSLW